MPTRPSPTSVFLSYASEDAVAAARICESLRAVGVEVWHDQSTLRGGDAWDTQIKQQIHDCALFIPVISAHTNARTEGYFRREWNLAARRLLDMAQDTALLVPVVIDETREAGARVPEEFLRVHWTRLPDGETPPAFAERVRQLLELHGAPDSGSHPLATPVGTVYGLARSKRQALLAVVAIGAVAAALAIGWAVREWGARDQAPPAELALAPVELPARNVAVLAFENRGGSEGAGILAQGVPETILHQLGLLPGLTVIAPGSSFAFRDGGEDLRVIGRKLNVRYLLAGSVQAAGNRLRVTSRLVDAQTGASVWSAQFDPTLEDLFDVQDQIALAVARALKLTLDTAGAPATGARASSTKNYDAYFEFLRGRALLANVRMKDLPAAIKALSAALWHDPTFSSPYVLLARARVLQAEQEYAGKRTERFATAVASAIDLLNQAIELDPQNGEAYVERGYLNLFSDLAEADADMRRGLELAPNYARGYEGLAAILFQSVARRREALAMIEKARQLDPLELRLDVIKATYLYYGNGDLAKSSELLGAILEREPLFVPALARLAELRAAQGEFADCVALAEQAVELDPGNDHAWRYLAVGYYALDEPAAAADAMRHAAYPPAVGAVWGFVHVKEWRKAGEAAYTLIASGQSYFQDELQVAIAIRRHARVTGDYRRAIKALESWASVTWDGDEPVLQGQLDVGFGVVALADMLMATGEHKRARALLEEQLADSELQIRRYGRGEIWLNGSRAVAFALLGRPDEAMAMLKRLSELGFQDHQWHQIYEDDPAFESLNTRKDFLQLQERFRVVDAREREQYLRMRAEGRITDRVSKS